MTTRRWTEVLDAIEARVAAQRAALDADEAGDLGPFAVPAGVGPLPAALEARAVALLAECRDVEAELAGALVHVGQDLAVVRKLGASTAPVPGARFLDTAL